MNKTAIVVLSDPKNGGEEALGRLFNGLAAAYDIKQTGGKVSILFQGTGTRWPSLISKADHPAHGSAPPGQGHAAGPAMADGCA